MAPTMRMRTLAKRWLTDRVTLSVVTYPTDTRPLGKATVEGSGLPLLNDYGQVLLTDEGEVLYADDADAEMRALVRLQSVDLVDGTTVRRDLRELRVWLDDTDLPLAGMRMTINECGDPTLVGKFGEITSVERDSIRAVRRCTVRLGNDD
jgi:hypothetical protein